MFILYTLLLLSSFLNIRATYVSFKFQGFGISSPFLAFIIALYLNYLSYEACDWPSDYSRLHISLIASVAKCQIVKKNPNAIVL